MVDSARQTGWLWTPVFQKGEADSVVISPVLHVSVNGALYHGKIRFNLFIFHHNQHVFLTLFFLCVVQQPHSGLGHLTVQISGSHTDTHNTGRTPLNE